MKTFNFFEKLWEHSRTLRRVGLVLVMCLMAMPMAWGAKGFFSDGQWNIKYWNGGGSDKWGSSDSGYGNNSYIDLGVQTNLNLKGSWVKTWSNDNWTQSEVCWYVGFTNESMTYQNKVNKSAVQGDQTWEGFGIDYDLIANAPVNPGPNTVYMYWRLDDNVSTSTSRILYTIPGFTTTSTSQTFDNTAVSSTNDKTISFGTHYGTALTTGNCSITGTNSSEFTVRSITESGVTVRFSPTTPGNKSATLTITDAHGKTCTITLTAKTKHTVTYNTTGKEAGSAPSDATQYEYNTTVTVKDNTGLMTKSGKVFAGWATSSSRASDKMIDYAPGATFSITQDMDLYPVWTNGSYFISVVGASTNGTKNTTDFIASQDLTNTATEVNGVTFSKSYYTTSGNQTTNLAGGSVSLDGKVIVYDAKTTQDIVRIYVKNTHTSSAYIQYLVIKEGTSVTSTDTVKVTLASGATKLINVDMTNTKGARLAIATSQYTKMYFTQIIAIEKGSTLPLPGASGYELASCGRLASASGSINGMAFSIASTPKFGGSTKIKLSSTSNYFQFTTSASVQLQVKISANKHFYVCTDKSNAATTGQSYGGSSGTTYNINLGPTGTYYLTGNDGDLTIDKIAFANYVAATAPTGFASTGTTSSSVDLSITDAKNSMWEIYYNTTGSTPNASTAATVSDITSKTPTVTGLTAGTDYYMWVRSVADYFNKSSWVALTSNPVTTATPSCEATAPSSVAISGGLLYFAGETIELTATPTGGNGPVTYQWYKGGKENVNAIEGATSATYTKASCAFDDAGSYYCKVTCGGSQSTWGQSGNAYDVKIPRLYVKTGHNNDLEKPDFGNVDFTRATASTATASIVLGSSGDYCFNIADGCGHYYGNSGTMQYNNTGWITNVSPQDCGLTTTNAGTYIFTINYSTWSQLTTTITFPSCTDPGLAFASASKSVTLCDDAPTNALTNTHGVTVSYASSDETVATVASDGTLTIKKAGTTTITASSLEQTISAVTYCADNASYTLTVNASTAAGLAYGTATMEKNVGDANFTNTLTNTNSLTGITYTSSNTAVATVDEDGEVTIKAAGTTTITASSAQQKVSSTCYAAGSATYSLTVYNVYTVTYDATDGTCGTVSSKTVTGEVTLPTPTHASYSFDGWYTTAGVKAGNAGAKYSPSGNITLYAKWSGSCAGGGGTSCVTWEGTPSAWTTGSMTVDSKMVITADPSDASKTTVDASQTISKNPETITKTVITIKGKDLYISGNLSDESEITSLTISASSNQDAKTSGYAVVFSPNSTFSSGVTVQTYGTVPSLNETYDEEKLIHEFTPASGTKYFRIYRNISAGTEIGDYTVPSGGVGGDQNIRIFEIKACKAGSTCYTVTYHGNGATSGYVNDPAQYAKDADPEVLDCGYTRTGYAFIGWADGTDHRDAETVDYQPGDIIEDISSDVTLYAIWKQIKYFKGTSSSSWNTSGNWSPSGVPARTDPVVIQANVTVDTDEAKALRVDIETGNTLTINAGMALIIAETLTKAGGATEAADVIINSTRDAGVGALIIGSEAGDNAATMNFETKAKLVGGSTVNQFIGSPFSNAAPYVDYGQQLYKFCPKQNGDRGWWQSHTSLATMTPFWGYNVLCTETSFLDLNWTGKLNPSESKTITDFYYNGSSETDNMFANSWTAPIHVGAFEDGDFVNASTTLYMFNAGTPAQEAGHSDDDATNGSTEPGTYISIPIHSAPYAGIGVIPSMQAFYVLATGSGASLTLDYNKIVYTPALTSVGITPNRAPRRDVEVDEPEVIKLRVQSETGWAANTYVLGRADFAEGYEDGWDGAYIEGESATPKLYTPSVDGNMFVNCLPQIDGTVVGFRKGSADSQYTFTFGYEGNEEYYFKDLKLDTETRIDGEHSYTFTAEAEDNAARFIIIRKTPTIATGVEDVENGTVVVRKLIIDDKVYIIRGGMMYDVTGKMIK